MSLILGAATDPQGYAERFSAKLLDLGCSPRYAAEARARIMEHSERGPEYGTGIEWLRPGEEPRDKRMLRERDDALAKHRHGFV